MIKLKMAAMKITQWTNGMLHSHACACGRTRTTTALQTQLSYMPEFGVESISLDYREARRTDRYGNSFKYRAKLYGANHRDLGRWAYDVYLLSAQ
jgi:hypothetical protein